MTTTLPKGKDAIVSYTREFPNGTPMVILRGKGTIIAATWLSKKFEYNKEKLGWVAQMGHDELYDVLADLEDSGYNILPAKTQMHAKYILDDFPG